MYTPSAFAEDEWEELHAIMNAASLPILISPSATALSITHLPLHVCSPDTIMGHMAKANTHWKDALPGSNSVAVFTATDGYVSPSWYPSKKETEKVVPTWNYQAVHATGQLEIIEDQSVLLSLVTNLTTKYEVGRPEPWAVSDAPADYIAAQLKGIVGVVLHVTKLEGKVKLSQNKSTLDRAGVINGAQLENPSLAAAMRKVI